MAGATGIDAALLAGSAAEGIKPQTIEHLQTVDLLGLDRRHRGASPRPTWPTTTGSWIAWPRSRRCSPRGRSSRARRSVPVSALTGQGLDELQTKLAGAGESAARAPPASRAWRSIAASS